jgi:chemotaxis signal transduction protein
MDMRTRFGMPVAPAPASGKLVIVSLVRQILALAVDDVLEVISVPVDAIKPSLDTANDFIMEHLLGVCLFNSRVYMLLDIDSLLGPAEYREINHAE